MFCNFVFLITLYHSRSMGSNVKEISDDVAVEQVHADENMKKRSLPFVLAESWGIVLRNGK